MLALDATPARAVPEMGRFGYFSCSTCHVSPSGGGILTPYGRALSAERLSTWSRPGEEQPLEGLVTKTPDWLLVGGDVRYAQTYVETSQARSGRWIRMQTDLAAAIVLPHVTIVGAGGPHGESTDPHKDAKMSWREYYAKVDVLDSLSVRGGRFYPRYGLNIPEHVSNIRSGLGFDEGQENENGEVTWSSESDEVAVTRLFGIPTGEIDGAREKGWTLNWSHYLLNHHRLGVSLLQAEVNGEKRTAAGLNGVFTLSDKWFLMSEVDRQTRRPKGDVGTHDELYVFNRLGFEPIHGVVPFLVSEVTEQNIRTSRTRSDLWGFGTQWYPRPHFDFEAQVAASLFHADYTFAASGYLIAHYYL